MTTYFRVCNVETGEDLVGINYDYSPKLKRNNTKPIFGNKVRLLMKKPTATLERYNLFSDDSWPKIEIIEVEITEVARFPDEVVDYTYFKKFIFTVFGAQYLRVFNKPEIVFMKNAVKKKYKFRYILVAKNKHEKPLGIAKKCKIGYNDYTATFLLLESVEDVIYAKMQYGDEVTAIYDYQEMRKV